MLISFLLLMIVSSHSLTHEVYLFMDYKNINLSIRMEEYGYYRAAGCVDLMSYDLFIHAL